MFVRFLPPEITSVPFICIPFIAFRFPAASIDIATAESAFLLNDKVPPVPEESPNKIDGVVDDPATNRKKPLLPASRFVVAVILVPPIIFLAADIPPSVRIEPSLEVASVPPATAIFELTSNIPVTFTPLVSVDSLDALS